MPFTPLNTPSKALAIELGEIITQAGIYSPRSQQVYIGPSEVGQECTRKLAYKLLVDPAPPPPCATYLPLVARVASPGGKNEGTSNRH